MLFPEVGFNLGKPSPKSPPMPGNLGALEAAELLLLPLFDAVKVEEPPAVRLLFALTELLLLLADFPPTDGADLSFVTVFFKAFPCCIDLSNAPRSVVPPPPDDLALKAATGGGLGGPDGAGGGPGGGGGGGIFLLVFQTSQLRTEKEKKIKYSIKSV